MADWEYTYYAVLVLALVIAVVSLATREETSLTTWAQEEILRRVAGNDEFRRQHQIRLRRSRFGTRLQNAGDIAGDVAQLGVDLGQGNFDFISHDGNLTGTGLMSIALRAGPSCAPFLACRLLMLGSNRWGTERMPR